MYERSNTPSRILQIAAIVIFLAAALYFAHSLRDPFTEFRIFQRPPSSRHPIDLSISAANAESRRIQDSLIYTLSDAADAYRARRGRHPPPRFDKWVEFAIARDAVIHEEFFDQIHEDLDPFWGVEAERIRYMAQTWKQSISIRNGVAQQRNDSIFIAGEWLKLWMGAIKEIEHELPDVDLAFNNVDEPRVVVPWVKMIEHMQAAFASKHTRLPNEGKPIVTEFTPLPALVGNPPLDKYNWSDDEDYWYKVRVACETYSRGSYAELKEPFAGPIDFQALLKEDPLGRAHVHNWTSTRSVCEHSQLRYLHGAFIAPGTPDVTHDLFPLFSGCKVKDIHNDILVPAAEYFTTNEEFLGGSIAEKQVPWEQKKSMVFWRGRATGGNSNRTTFHHHHRHRLVATLNGTQVALAEEAQFSKSLAAQTREKLFNETAQNIYLPNTTTVLLAALQSTPTTFGAWTKSLADAGLTHLFCSPQAFSLFTTGDECEYMIHWYKKVDNIKMHEMFKYKFLPDADGQSYSGRYRALLQSSSMPIKATVYSEWHDRRLIPWHHFVPMDNMYRDWWIILEYFAGYDPKAVAAAQEAAPVVDNRLLRKPHDDEARAIAENGMHWSTRTMRRDDMIIYMYRLILEYARVCDDRRLDLGWVDDLL